MQFLETIKKYPGIALASLVTVIILWGMLLPGYILTMDMVFTPSFHINHASIDLLNSLPLEYILSFLYLLFPGWIVEKLALIATFFFLSYLSFTYLPVPKKTSVKVFASLLYTANSFVYVRMLAGQWTIIFAYALLPLLIHLLLKMTHEPVVSPRKMYMRAIRIALCLAAIAVFSLHIFMMALLVCILWITIDKIYLLKEKNFTALKKLFFGRIVSLIVLLILTSYWTIPAFTRHVTIEQNFNDIHFEAFAPSEHPSQHGTIPVGLNLLSLSGFWGEHNTWANYFVWPQISETKGLSSVSAILFWISFLAVIALVIHGIFRMFKHRDIRRFAIFMSLTGLFAFIFATGAAHTPFQSFNYFLYHHIFFWSGFRDSQKFIAFLSLSYAIFAGFGFERVLYTFRLHEAKKELLELNKVHNEKYYEEHDSPKHILVQYVLPVLFLIPIFFGMYVWMGFAHQLKPVWYPLSWSEAKQVLDGTESKILVLPWEGYFSLKFNNFLITANPATQFFGPRIVSSQNFRLGGIYDQSTDAVYSELDMAIRQDTVQDPGIMNINIAQLLHNKDIGYVMFFQDLVSVDIFKYNFLKNPEFEILLDRPEVKVYRIRR